MPAKCMVSHRQAHQHKYIFRMLTAETETDVFSTNPNRSPAAASAANNYCCHRRCCSCSGRCRFCSSLFSSAYSSSNLYLHFRQLAPAPVTAHHSHCHRRYHLHHHQHHINTIVDTTTIFFTTTAAAAAVATAALTPNMDSLLFALKVTSYCKQLAAYLILTAVWFLLAAYCLH